MSDQPVHRTDEDYEDIPPRPPTPGSLAVSTRVRPIATLLEELGFTVVYEPGWETRNPTYHWEPHNGQSAPHGLMIHHTVSTPYDPRSCYPAPEGRRTDGRTICNALITESGAIHMVSADPANYSSGLGELAVLEDYVQSGRHAPVPQSGSLGPEWYGNRYYLNVEVSHRGDSSLMAAAQERAVLGVIVATCQVMGWDTTRVLSHSSHRGTKVDPRWDGPWTIPPNTIVGLKDTAQAYLDDDTSPGSCPWIAGTSSYAACDDHYYPPSDLEPGIGTGQNQGSCAVPESQYPAINWAFDSRLFHEGNRYRYDYRTHLSEGRYAVLEYRNR